MREVKPIKDAKKLEQIAAGLADYQDEHERRIYLLFMMGICTGLRIGDLVGLKAAQVNRGDKLRLIEEKTGKKQEIKIPKRLREVLDYELMNTPDNDFIFKSRQRDKRGRVKHITVGTAENDMKLIAKWFNIKTPFSCHSMRKTFGFWHYQENKNLPMLAKQFNHADISVTSRYIGLDEEAAQRAAENLYIDILPGNKKTAALKRSNQMNAPIKITRPDRTKQKKAYAERMKAGKEKAAREKGGGR